MLNKKINVLAVACTMLAGAAFSSAASAHTRWVLPSNFTVSTEGGEWLTFDVTAANATFVFDKPAGSENARIIMPDGRKERPNFVLRGKRRSVFDFEFIEAGTHKVTINNEPSYFTRFKAGRRDTPKRMRANKIDRVALLPKESRDVETAVMFTRVESYITVGKPNTKAFELEGKYLELMPITHPSDIVAEEPVRLQLFFNGKAQAGVEVEVVREGMIYRNQQEEVKVVSDEKGFVTFTPEIAGRYLLVAKHQDVLVDNQFADKMMASVNLTFEAVLP
ncbi:DUF4198 domain-containing protein [Psychromonas sp. RZ22]|uniref:DUF4198 domain-containing protein n=1 Tax=Psychromonas algarum TaxID=2555643 RepID=UPI0010678A4F|nr:DUF4198 domain-containing protein [Psychromonas sp. RZ22]TEW54591.1 DUF4198 domain-containing protein [Psychromonas sp. RZ22]